MATKICNQCKVEKDLLEFNKKRGTCRSCQSLWQKLHRENREVSEKNKERSKNFYLNNKEEHNKKTKEYYENNKEILSQKQKEYNERNKEHKKEYRKLNKERILKHNREYVAKKYKEDVEFRIAKLIRGRVSKALRRMKYKKQTTLNEYLGCTFLEFKEHIEKQFRDGMTWENQGEYWHLDHIVPLAYFDLTTEEIQKLAMHYTNIQPLLAQQNREKGARINKEDIPAKLLPYCTRIPYQTSST